MTATQFSSDSTPDERGNAITIPAGMCASFKIAGIRMFPRIPATGKTVLVSLYSNTTALQTVTWDSDVAGAAATTENTPIRILFDETTLSTLTCGTEYIVAVAPQETSSNLAVRWFTFDAANDVTALPLGTAWYAVSRADAGSWTTDTSSRYTIDLILSDVTEPTGGSTPRVLGSN
jgi:hypothetical protein